MKSATYALIEKTLEALKEEYPRELSDSQLATGDPDFPPLILAARDALAALFGWDAAADMDAWLATPCENEGYMYVFGGYDKTCDEPDEVYYGSDRYFEDGYEAGYMCY